MPRPPMRFRPRRLALAAVAVVGALLLPITAVVVAAPAIAGGSDDPTPYTVSASGVTLPAGQTFHANGHVNAQVIPLWQYTPGETYRARGADWTPMQVTRHFDPNNNQPGGAYIGQSYYPFSGAQQQLPADGYCVIWVQVDGFNEHFGEGGQDPICTTPPTPSEPTPSEPTPSEPTPSEPTPSEPTPSEPTPSEPTPSEPTPSEPTPSEPTPSEPAVVHPQIQDYVGACDAAFVLDNRSSTVDVTYTVNGVDFLVPAGTAVHTDADGTRIAPIDGQYVIVTDTGRTWSFPARECAPVVPVPSDPTPSDPTPSDPGTDVPAVDPPTPSDPTPSDPMPSDPMPSDPTPSDPTPSDPTPSDPTPSDPTPSDPTPSDPTPSDPTPSDPTPSDPTPSDPTPSDPTPSAPTPSDVPVTSEEPTAVQPTAPQPTAAQPTAAQPTAAASDDAATLPRTGGEPLLLVLLLGGVLMAVGATVRFVRR